MLKTLRNTRHGVELAFGLSHGNLARIARHQPAVADLRAMGVELVVVLLRPEDIDELKVSNYAHTNVLCVRLGSLERTKLVAGKMITMTHPPQRCDSPDCRWPAGLRSIKVWSGKTEASMYEKLRKTGAIGPKTKVFTY